MLGLVVRARRENAVKTRRVEQAVVSWPLPKNYSSRSYESSLDGAASECRQHKQNQQHGGPRRGISLSSNLSNKCRSLDAYPITTQKNNTNGAGKHLIKI
ncbi:hypothetical protein TNCV_1845361 [Trichonephila clavipes]|nr:hypothetical protein TNCV_1845361 [Trichonephila clavipes]